MIGAIIGDIAGSRFEFNNTNDYNFEFFHKDCSYTDDTICTVAVADAILRGVSYKDSILYWCRKYPRPMGAYGGSFSRWLQSDDPQPYNSFGNGAAMRVSPCGWAFKDEAQTLRAALASAAPTHNHIEGLIGASTVARAIFKLRTMSYPSFCDGEIYDFVESTYGENWSKDVPARGVFDETCRGCVPLAFFICHQSNSFEDAIRNAVWHGGDSDTLAAIVGSLAEARWGIPIEMQKMALNMLPQDMLKVVINFIQKFK
ncbi:ADP-ribosylglycohydrolase family protein [Sangeribacter muris]|uniref:ADP-ribosylglycohydrolase family protein n=1 Tax=Sangeribacter muris TaxID=2880703 RepID=UPI00244DD7D2|nr:ADP-ribosylglycohydrolase family protein [Sangeribacter muris]